MSSWLTLACLLTAAPGADTVVVTPPIFRDALRPWLQHREAQGHSFEFIDSRDGAEQIRARIRGLAASGTLRAVLLVGDAAPAGAPDDETRDRLTPTHWAPAKVNIHWGSEPRIATDNWFGDLDDDRVPDLAVGRLTADTEAELQTMVSKILAYETDAPGEWLRRLNFVAGVGGFGVLADSILETAARRFLTDGIPPAYRVSMTYGSWRSPYCPDPRLFRNTTIERMNEGSLFWVYIGHGQRRGLDRVQVPGGSFSIFDTRDIAHLRRPSAPSGTPIAVFLSCYTGAFDEPRDCLAEHLLRSEHGPVAVYSGSRVTMPYAMAVMSSEMMKQVFEQRRATLGEVVLHAKRRMVATEDEASQDVNRKLLDSVAAVISPRPELLEAERREHVLLFNLLGDPLLRLPHAQPMELRAASEVIAGERLRVQVRSEFGGVCRIELACRRDRLRQRVPPRPRFVPTADEMIRYQETYRLANDPNWVVDSRVCSAGEWEFDLDVPANVRGPCHVRLFIRNDEQCAVGAHSVYVRRPPMPADDSQ